MQDGFTPQLWRSCALLGLLIVLMTALQAVWDPLEENTWYQPYLGAMRALSRQGGAAGPGTA